MFKFGVTVLFLTIALTSQSVHGGSIYLDGNNETLINKRDNDVFGTSACFKGTLYYFETVNKRNRHDAATQCEHVNMSLVSVESCEENSFIVNYIKKIGFGNQHFWISAWQNGDREWYWGTGQKLDYNNWKLGEPNYKQDEFCVHYRLGYLQWNDEKCNQNYYYVCEAAPNTCDR